MTNNELIDNIKKWAYKNSSEVSIDIGFDILDVDAIDLNELIVYLDSIKTKE